MHGTPDRGRDPTSQASDPTTLPGGEYPANSRGTKSLGLPGFEPATSRVLGPVLNGCRWPLSLDPVVNPKKLYLTPKLYHKFYKTMNRYHPFALIYNTMTNPQPNPQFRLSILVKTEHAGKEGLPELRQIFVGGLHVA
ncbi:hypothetical protein Hanom_Chr17g01575621 [Helianthus anomalus]